MQEAIKLTLSFPLLLGSSLHLHATALLNACVFPLLSAHPAMTGDVEGGRLLCPDFCACNAPAWQGNAHHSQQNNSCMHSLAHELLEDVDSPLAHPAFDLQLSLCITRQVVMCLSTSGYTNTPSNMYKIYGYEHDFLHVNL